MDRTMHTTHGKERSMIANGNGYQLPKANEQGRAQRAPQQISNGTRTKISFDPPRVPVLLRPESVPTRSVEGRDGPQYMWFFADNQVAWFDPDFHQEILACLEVSGCNEIAITKHVRRGQPPRFEVQPVRDETEQPGGYDPAPPPPPARRQSVAEVAARRIEEIKRSQAAPPRGPSEPRFHHEEAIEAETAPHCNAMFTALMEAMMAVHEAIAIATAQGLTWKPTGEDIRALAITIYIQSHGGRK
jgi:hypothetical protein